NVGVGLRFALSLPRFLRQPVDAEAARAALPRRFQARAAVFLELLHRAVYQGPSNPYRQLLALAGCAWGDLVQLVEREGIEGALAELVRCGVYLTVDEYKGRRALRRGTATVETRTTLLRNPLVSSHLEGQ